MWLLLKQSPLWLTVRRGKTEYIQPRMVCEGRLEDLYPSIDAGGELTLDEVYDVKAFAEYVLAPGRMQNVKTTCDCIHLQVAKLRQCNVSRGVLQQAKVQVIDSFVERADKLREAENDAMLLLEKCKTLQADASGRVQALVTYTNSRSWRCRSQTKGLAARTFHAVHRCRFCLTQSIWTS